MENEFKKKCDECNERKEIVELESGFKYEIYKYSCGHSKYISLSYNVPSLTYSKLVKYFKLLKKKTLRAEFGTEEEPKKQEKERFIIDREKNLITHKVEEQNEKGEWIVIEEQEKPFP